MSAPLLCSAANLIDRFQDMQPIPDPIRNRGGNFFRKLCWEFSKYAIDCSRDFLEEFVKDGGHNLFSDAGPFGCLKEMSRGDLPEGIVRFGSERHC